MITWSDSGASRGAPRRSNPSMMFSAMSATIPCPFGGISHTSNPRYLALTGCTHSGRCSARSRKVKKPPVASECAAMARAKFPR